MRIISDIPQRSDEWHSFREGKISGSKAKGLSNPRYIPKAELLAYAKSKGYDFKPTLTIENIRSGMSQQDLDELDYTVVMNDSIYKLIAERIAKPINPNDYADKLDGRPFSMMTRGEILEEEARQKISEKLGVEVIEGRLWQSDFNDDIICSPDGEIVEKDGSIKRAVEIKCLDSWKLVKAFYENKYPIEYEEQAVQYFLVNEELETLYFCLYSDVLSATPDLELQIFEINRDEVQRKIEIAGMMEDAVLKMVNEEVARLMF